MNKIGRFIMAPRAHYDHSINNSTPDESVGSERVSFSQTISYTAPNNGADGIIVEHRDFEDGEPTPWQHWVTLPPVIGRYEGSDGLNYIIPKDFKSPSAFAASAGDILKTPVFLNQGYHDAHSKMSGKGGSVLFDIWFTVANALPAMRQSPSVLEGLPPLAPALTPLQDDHRKAGRALKYVGERMTPTARAMTGLGLVSPWLTEVGGTSILVHLYGTGGYGKSSVLRSIAAEFGDPRERRALMRTFLSTGNGALSRATNQSYLPMILDEAQNADKSVVPENLLVSMVNGATKMRSTRSGQAAGGEAEWNGAVFTSGNNPLNLDLELWDRRGLQIPATENWVGQFDKPEWAEIHRAMRVYAGHPWLDILDQFTPGTERAEGIVSMVADSQHPGPGSLGTTGALAHVGALILGDFAGMDWGEGVLETWMGIMQIKTAEKRDPAKEVAEAILDSFTENPNAWSADPRGEAAGRPASVPESCGITHDDQCQWYDVFNSVMKEAMGQAGKSRLAQTRFRYAVYAEAGRLDRKVSVAGGARPRVHTVCFPALAVLAEGESDRVEVQTPAPAGPPEPEPEVEFDNEAMEQLERIDKRKQEKKSAPFETKVSVGDDDVLASLERAAAEGASDVVGPNAWVAEVETIKREWNTTWEGVGQSGMMDKKSNGHRLRLWAATGDPDAFAQALRRYRQDHPNYAGPTRRVHEILTESRVRRPRFQLPKAEAELWTPGEIMHPTGWGQPSVKIDPETVTQYDRNKAYLSAIAQANLAPLRKGEDFTVYGPDAPVDRKLGGMYRIVVPEWDSPLPGPNGRVAPGSQVWTSPEIMRLYAEAGVRPKVIEAHLAPVQKVNAVQKLHSQVVSELGRYAGHPAQMIPKSIYQQSHSALASTYARGKANRVYRPDWAQAIRDNAWASVVRRTWRIHAEDERYVPVGINVDAIYYPSDLPTPEGMPVGTDLGQYKIEVAS